MTTTLVINGAALLADPSGALFWPAAATLVVADLHLEKGSGFARRGTLLPPYDSAATLRRLAAAVDAHRPRRVLCLGDSFHDAHAPKRLESGEIAILAELTRRTDWIWIAGNHDPDPPKGLGGRVASEVTEGPLVFRHEAHPDAIAGEVSGHFHPKASIPTRGRRVSARCFVEDGNRLILPAFGAYAGGLDVFDPAIRGLLARDFAVHVIGRERVHRFACR
ncbi:MAG: ligase-associated DNA damage response endonuclease PdeM [Alphaproteobacteria bacterium]|nr:ligase-associated DNA damage response endonuclease PdeM [Alphaproteobacteria bacterium]